MKKLTLLISWIFKFIGALLTVLLVVQVYDALSKDNRFLFFQLILIFVWAMGALMFWMFGIIIGKSYKRGQQEQEDA